VKKTEQNRRQTRKTGTIHSRYMYAYIYIYIYTYIYVYTYMYIAAAWPRLPSGMRRDHRDEKKTNTERNRRLPIKTGSMYMFIQVYDICIYIYTYIFAYVYVYLYTYTCCVEPAASESGRKLCEVVGYLGRQEVCICVYKFNIHIHIYVYTYIYIYVYICIHIYVYMLRRDRHGENKKTEQNRRLPRKTRTSICLYIDIHTIYVFICLYPPRRKEDEN